MAEFNLTPNTTALSDREINEIYDTYMESVHLLGSWRLLPFIKEIRDDWDHISSTVENAKNQTGWLADREIAKNTTIGSGYDTVISADIFGSAFEITWKTQKKFEATGDPKQKERFKMHIDEALTETLKGITEFIDLQVMGMVSDCFAGVKYVHADTKPVISTTHAFKSGQTFSNRIDVGGTVNKAFGTDVIDFFATTKSRIVNSTGKKVLFKPDTIVVPSGTTVAQTVKRLMEFTFEPTTINDVSIYQNGVKGYKLIEVPTLGVDEDGNDLAYRDTMYFVYSSAYNSKPVYEVNFPTPSETTMNKERNGTKTWDNRATMGLGVTANPPVGLFGSKGTNAA